MKFYPIILASQSPRRVQLLKQIGLQFKQIEPHINEVKRKNESANLYVKRMAYEKGHEVLIRIKNRKVIIISADTIVISPQGDILGKPKNKKEAFEMLKKMQGREHHVLTAYALLFRHKRLKSIVRCVKTKVKMTSISDSEIKNYIKSKEPLDKAGAYGAQGKGGAYIETIRGSYTAVVGLPLAQLLKDLENLLGDDYKKLFKN